MWTIRKITSSFLLALLSLSSSSSNSLVTAQLRDEIDFQWNTVKMPFPVSDIMANYMSGPSGDDDDDDEDDGFVIITGGCDSVKGNERLTIDIDNNETLDLFECMSVTNVTLKFDPVANIFTTMSPAPHARLRHAAAVVQGELYLLGGRDSLGNMVTAIDSYNPVTDTWTTRGALPDDVVTSDLTAWSYNNRYIYIHGGFVFNYTAVATTYRLDMGGVDEKKPTTFEDMGFALLSPAPSGGRGDIHAVELYGFAYMAGGITHTSAWCEGLTTTERYHMLTDTWETLSDLNVGRADMAVAVLNNKIISMGGETKPENCVNVSDPAYGSFPASHVEVLLVDSTHAIGENEKQSKWEFFEEFNDERFRFAAAVVPGAPSRIYTFGGQLPFDFTCDCFPTSDDVGIGTEVYTPEATSDATSGSESSSSSSMSRGAMIAVIVIGFLLFVACIVLLAKNLAAQKKAGPRPKPATTAGPTVAFEPTEPEAERHETA